MAFQVASFVLFLEPEDGGAIGNRYLGSALRGAFGRSLRRTVCVMKGMVCDQCPLQSQCPYVYFFETPGNGDAGWFRIERAPHPFVISPPGPFDPRNSSIPVRLVLIGRAIDYLPHVIWTFHSLARLGLGVERRPYALRRVLAEDGETLADIWREENSTLLAGRSYRREIGTTKGDLAGEEAQRIRLRFTTPLRIRHKRRLCTRLTFPILMTNVLRRLYLLDRYHGDATWEFDHLRLIEMAAGVECTDYKLRWFDWTRYSSRQDAKMQMGGLIGEVEFAGEMGAFLPYLRAAEDVHVGRNTSFGLGRMQIVTVQ